MSSFLSRLNLSLQERRLVVGVAVIVFVVINFWFVRPHFKDLGAAKNKLSHAKNTLEIYQEEKARIPEHQARLEKLKGEGSDVLSAEQSIHFQRILQVLAQSNHVEVTRWGQAIPVKGSSVNTNYFEELTLGISVNTGEAELVDFLYNLGAGNSMIRVRDMTLNPGPMDQRAGGSTNLVVTLTLVASYQKKSVPAPKTDMKPKAEAKMPAPAAK